MAGEYLTIKEFAAAAGVSEQAVYKRINKSLKPYCSVIDGKKKISKDGLILYQKPTIQPTTQPTYNNQVETVEINAPQQDLNNQESTTIPATGLTTEQEQIKSLNRMIEIVQKELEVKNKQIDDLNNRLAEALKTVEAQNILISQQQHLALLDKTEAKAEKITDQEEEITQVGEILDRQVRNTTNLSEKPQEATGIKGFFKRIFG